VVLAPAFIRMMMALSALHARAEKDLRGVVDELVRGLNILVPHCRRRFGLVADRAQDLAGEYVIGLVSSDGFANPVVERECAVSAGLAVLLGAALNAKNVAPFVGEEVAIIG